MLWLFVQLCASDNSKARPDAVFIITHLYLVYY